jgi:hypothetical protein
VLEVRGLDAGKQISPYVIVRIGNQQHRTTTLKGVSNPNWKEDKFTFDLDLKLDQRLSFEVWDDVRGWPDTRIGTATTDIPSNEGTRAPQWLKLNNVNSGELLYNIHVKLPSVDLVGVVEHRPTEDLTIIESLINDIKALGLKGLPDAAKVLALIFSKELQDDRKGGRDALVHLLAHLPANSELLKMLETRFIQSLWDDIEKPPKVLAGDYFRRADGSRNSLLYPWVGQAGTHYARTITEARPHVPVLPDPGEIFDLILDRANTPGTKKFVPHPNNVNVVLFYLATLITHDLFYSDPLDPTRNLTTHYLDLSPLYGRNQNEQDGVRLRRDGLLKPDAFADLRLALQPQGVAALLVVFSRNHNYIAKKLLEINEGSRFSDNTLAGFPISQVDLDERLFQTARHINCRCYLNIIMHDYLRAILALDSSSFWYLDPTLVPPPSNSTGGNQVAVEFNFVYRWHSAIGEEDDKWASEIIAQYLELIKQSHDSKRREKPVNFDEILRKLLGASDEQWKLGTPIKNLNRKADGYFDTRDLGIIFQKGLEQVAGQPGANHTPSSFKFIEAGAINQGRIAGVCTLNSFRRHFKLQPHATFRDLNPDPAVVEALSQLYETAEDVELYPGLIAEQSKPNGSALQYTISRAILSDAVNLIRNDRFLMEDFTPNNVTYWGYRFANGDPALNGGSIMQTLLLQHLPDFFPTDSTYLWDPFHIPAPGTPKPSDYISPLSTAVKVIRANTCKHVQTYKHTNRVTGVRNT